MSATNVEVIGLVVVMGMLGSLGSSFLGDSGWHLPMNEDGIVRPGYLGNMLIGALAAVASWGMQKGAVLVGGPVSALTFSTADMAHAIVIGFAGASWFKSHIEQVILRRTAVVAASRAADPEAAQAIATCTPIEALRVANKMKT